MSGELSGKKKKGRGISPTKNPSERFNGSVRYKLLLEDDANGQWAKASAKIARHIDAGGTISLSVVHSVVAPFELQAWTGDDDYSNIRMVRSMVSMFEKNFSDTPADWNLWYRMSTSVKTKCDEFQVSEYKQAVRHRNAMRRFTSNPRYSFGDLICYICLIPKEE